MARTKGLRTAGPPTRSAARVIQAKNLRGGMAQGRMDADERLARKGKGAMANAGTSGVLIAEGDSWFDYPGEDVLSVLEDRFDYRVESVAHKSDTVEDMAYGKDQIDTT